MYKNIALVASAVIFLVFSTLLFYQVPHAKSCLDVDSTGYDRLACNFNQENSLLDPLDPARMPIQTIGYPLFVGLIYKIAGHNYTAVIAVQALLGLICVWLTFLIAAHLFSDLVAAITILLFSFNVGLLVYTQFLLAEIVLLTMFLAFIERFVTYYTQRTTRALGMAGFFLGVSIIIKPVALLFAPIVALLVAIINRKKLAPMVTALIIFTLCFSLPVGCYMMRNKITYGKFSIAPMINLNIYHCFLSKVIAQAENISPEQASERIPCSLHSTDENDWQQAKILFWRYAWSHPFLCIKIWFENVSKTLFGLYTTQLKILLNPHIKGGDVSFFKEQGTLFERAVKYVSQGAPSIALVIIGFFEVFMNMLRYIFALIALVVLFRQRYYFLCAFFGSYSIYQAIITGFDGCCRYRVTFEPIILILAAVGIAYTLLGQKKLVSQEVQKVV